MHILRALIQEHIRSDPKTAGEGYFEDLSRALLDAFSLHGDEPMPEVMRDISRKFLNHIRFLGAGSYRIAFSIGDNRVIKISLDSVGDSIPGESGHQMNRDDFELGNNDELEGIFPKVFAHAPDFEWIIQEKVRPAVRSGEYIRFFKSPLLPNPETLDDIEKDSYASIISAAFQMKSVYFEDDKRLGSIGIFGPAWQQKNGDKTLGELREDLYERSRAFRGLLNAANLYKIDMDEFRPYNIGVANDGRFVMLDSSIFPDR
jgi:hypothetical protein